VTLYFDLRIINSVKFTIMSNYSMMQHSFVSPMRGASTAAVPHNKREMSSSPYMHKKRAADVSDQPIKILIGVERTSSSASRNE
jgi:hypothetical protein